MCPMKKALKITGVFGLLLILALASIVLYVNLALPDVSAASDIVVTTEDQALIERGAYLANHVAVCIDCLSTRDWTKFSGPIVPGTEGKGGEVFDEKMGLPGTFYSKNITLMVFHHGQTEKYIDSLLRGLLMTENLFFLSCPILAITKWIRKM